MKDWSIPTLLAVLCIAFLLIAAFVHLPYGAYTLLRILVCASSGWWFFIANDEGRKVWAVAFAANAILFNPVVPIYLRRSQWKALDLIDCVFFAAWLVYFFATSKSMVDDET